jgi:hypothetical protein
LVGEVELPTYKLKELGVEHQRRLSPGIERICLITAATKSFFQSEKDLEILIGLKISKNSLHRLVDRYKEEEKNSYKEEVEEIAVDGGSICLKEGKQQQFKVARINKWYHISCFKNDELLVEKLEHLSKKPLVYLLGDGHDGVWNIFRELNCHKKEILDWYHLKENLYKQSVDKNCLKGYETQLWNGKKEEVIEALPRDNNFRKYLEKHRERVINYYEHQRKGLSSIGSGAVESSVKQIKTRTNIAGARWSKRGARKILSVRTNYLNGAFYN